MPLVSIKSRYIFNITCLEKRIEFIKLMCRYIIRFKRSKRLSKYFYYYNLKFRIFQSSYPFNKYILNNHESLNGK